MPACLLQGKYEKTYRYANFPPRLSTKEVMKKSKLMDWLNQEHNLDLNFLQWALPSFLALTAIIFELVEHGTEGDWMGAGFMGEMIIFGFMGPIIIALILGWMRLLMKAEKLSATASWRAPTRNCSTWTR
jgi:hypothetical protein